MQSLRNLRLYIVRPKDEKVKRNPNRLGCLLFSCIFLLAVLAAVGYGLYTVFEKELNKKKGKNDDVTETGVPTVSPTSALKLRSLSGDFVELDALDHVDFEPVENS